MRHFLVMMIAASAVNVQAQCLVNDLGLDSATVPAWVLGAHRTPDGVISAAVPFTQNPMDPDFFDRRRELIFCKTDTLGDPIWTRVVSPSNPNFRWFALGSLGNEDGGVTAFGGMYYSDPLLGPTEAYDCQFAIKMGPTGCMEWAKIYMVQDPLSNTPAEDWNSFTELNGGGYRMTLRRDSIHIQVAIDPQGVATTVTGIRPPVWSTGFGAATLAADNGTFTPFSMNYSPGVGISRCDPSGVLEANMFFSEGTVNLLPYEVMETSNGDLVVVMRRVLSYQPPSFADAVVRIDPSGTVVWAHVYDGPGAAVERATELQNGDLLLHGDMDLLHLDAAGVPLHAWQDELFVLDEISEEDGHLMLNKAPRDSTIDGIPGVFRPVAHIVQADDVLDLACGIPAVALPTYTPISLTPGSISFDPCTAGIAKSWDLAITNGCTSISVDTSDLSASLASWGAAPGFNSYIHGSIFNASIFPGSAMDVVLTVPSPLSIISAQPTPTSIVGNTITWSGQTALAGLASAGFQANLITPPDPQLIGTQISYGISVSQSDAELTLANNTYTFTQTIQGALDPNDKLVRTSSGLNDAEFYPGIDEWLDYTIRFQNTGTDTAHTVVVTDTLPAELSTSTLNIQSASHPYTYEFGGDGVLRFTFTNIMLPDSNVNEALSHGLVSFRIKPDDGLVLGTTITNYADIFFDFNPPIRTPDATVTISMPTSLPELHSDDLLIYPVPVREVLIAQLPEGFVVRKVDIHSSDGRLVRSPNLSPVNSRLDVGMQGLLPGLYVLSVEGVEGHRLTARFVKE